MEKNLDLKPLDEVTFDAPLESQPTVNLKIKNDWDDPVIFKMKSTKPDVFRMKPVFGIIPSKKANYDSQKCVGTKDHFTVVLAPAPPGCTSAKDTWKAWKKSKVKEVLLQDAIGAIRREIKVIYGTEVKEKKEAMDTEKVTQKSEETPIKKVEEEEEDKEAEEPKKKEEPKKPKKKTKSTKSDEEKKTKKEKKDKKKKTKREKKSKKEEEKKKEKKKKEEKKKKKEEEKKEEEKKEEEKKKDEEELSSGDESSEESSFCSSCSICARALRAEEKRKSS